MGIRAGSNMKVQTNAGIKIVKNRGGSVSGLSSHTEFRPIIMPGTYRRPNLEDFFDDETIKVLLAIKHPKRLPENFWSDKDLLLKYTDTGRHLAMKIVPQKVYKRDKKENRPETPLLFAEFQTSEFNMEELHPTHNPTSSDEYFRTLSENYDIVKNGDLELFEIPVINREAIFAAKSSQDKCYWLISQHQDYIDYLHYKFPERKLKFVANSKQLDDRLIKHGMALNNGTVANMMTTVGVLDARSQELLALTRLKILDQENANNNNTDRQMVESFEKNIKAYVSSHPVE